jgi:hypothetical protein
LGRGVKNMPENGRKVVDAELYVSSKNGVFAYLHLEDENGDRRLESFAAPTLEGGMVALRKAVSTERYVSVHAVESTPVEEGIRADVTLVADGKEYVVWAHGKDTHHAAARAVSGLKRLNK